MSLKQIVFRQFLEEGEKVNKQFRRNFPLSQLILSIGLTIGGAELIRWMFFCSYNTNFCPYESTGIYVYWVILAFGLYQTLRIYFRWYVNAILMTSESIMFVSWEKLFSPRNKRLDYWDLDIIEIDRSGLKSYVGNFGTLLFHKISGGDPIVFKEVVKPHKVEGIIMKNREVMVDEKNFTEESALKDLLSQLVQTHVRKNGQPERIPSSRDKRIFKNAHDLLKFSSSQEKNEQKKEIENTHFDNEILEIEKKLDDTGGIDIDL